MIDIIFYILVIFAFTLFFASIHWESELLTIFTAGVFIVMAIAAMQIQMPYIVISSADVVTEGMYVYSDYATSAFMFLMTVLQLPLFFIFHWSEKGTIQTEVTNG